MNYRHIYHAGNFADLIKHLILVAILKKLLEKDTGFTVLDAFAGIGMYDLTSTEAQKTAEYQNGIGMIPEDIIPNHPILSDYLAIIKSLNSPNLYPGSPYITSCLLREQDTLIAAELHPQDYAFLKYNMRHDNSAIHHIDGYNATKAFLPPKNNRGLVLLDGAFEVKDEYNKIIEALKTIKKRFSAGIVMIWHPIKNKQLTQKFYDNLTETGYSEFLKIEFQIDSKAELGMSKCGVVIANPPYIDNTLTELMKFLCNDIYKNRAFFLLERKKSLKK